MSRLVWDGGAWVRRDDEDHRAPTDVFGRPLPTRPIGPGWWVTAASGPVDDTGHPCGLCYDVSEAPDPSTGELRLVYHCVSECRRRISRLDVAHDDVLMASPATRSQVRALTEHCHLVLGDRLQAHLLRAPRAWLVGLLPVLHRLEETL